jgi:hypothetical protein
MSLYQPSFSDWFAESPLGRPSTTVDSLAYRFGREIKAPAPLGECFRFSHVIDKPIVSAIIVLFSIGSPSTVVRAISKIIIDSIQRFCEWAFAHISEEVLEIQPRIANSYSATAISRIGGVARIKASAFHMSPYDQD